MQKTTVHVEEIHLDEASPDPMLPLTQLLDGMQEAAGRHALTLGWGLSELMARDLTWVLARYHLVLPQWPLVPGVRTITTWPSGRQGLYALRDFHITGRDDLLDVKATSAWVVLDLVRRKPARLDTLSLDFEPGAGRMVVDDFAALPGVESEPNVTASFAVEPADIDLNDHVNNLVYLDWARRMLPAGSTGGRGALELEVAFLAEARRGDRVLGMSQSSRTERETVFIQSLRQAVTGRELTRLRWRWQSPGEES